MKTVLTLLALVTVVACGKKVEVVADAGVVSEPAKIEETKTVTVEEVLPKNFDEKLDKVLEESRKNADCRDN